MWVLAAACQPVPPSGAVRITPFSGAAKPGKSITDTMMCSCTACEPASCCVEEETPQDDNEDCNKGYDFSQCDASLTVSSCSGQCFQHRWRGQKDAGCAASRPDKCCAPSDRL